VEYLFHPDAETELNAAVAYYEECQKGLGLEFAREVHRTIQVILEFPAAWQRLDENIRRCLTNRFPFGVIYYRRKDTIVILAIMQLQKKPGYWKARI